MRNFVWFGLAVCLLAMLSVGCSNSETEVQDKKDSRISPKERPERPARIPRELTWRISTRSNSPAEYKIKSKRKNEDGAEPDLDKLIGLARDFMPKVQPIAPEDSIVRFQGYDIEFLVPSLEGRPNEQFYALYRPGTESTPAAISIIDSVGPNNIDLFPFYYQHLVIFFAHFHGEDVQRTNPLMVPGFFVNDFSGKGIVYIQPDPNKAFDSVDDIAAIMLLKNHLIPHERVALENGLITHWSTIQWKDSTAKEVRYNTLHGRACERDYVSGEILLEELQTLLKKRCGGANMEILPAVGQGRVPLWTEGPDYAFEILKPERRKELSAEDSLAVWLVHTSGGERRPRQRELSSLTLGEAMQLGAPLENIKAGTRPPVKPGISAGWDFRSMTVNQKKPGYQPRSARYHRQASGLVDYVRLVDESPDGKSNLALHLREKDDGIAFKVEYFGRDTTGEMIPGIFVFSQSARTLLYLLPHPGKSPTSLKQLAGIAFLDNDLRPKGLLTLKEGLPDAHYTYNYKRPDSIRYNEYLDRVTRVHLMAGEKCEVRKLNEKLTFKELQNMTKRPVCRGVKEEVNLALVDARIPAWIEGKLFPAEAKKVTKNPVSP